MRCYYRCWHLRVTLGLSQLLERLTSHCQTVTQWGSQCRVWYWYLYVRVTFWPRLWTFLVKLRHLFLCSQTYTQLLLIVEALRAPTTRTILWSLCLLTGCSLPSLPATGLSETRYCTIRGISCKVNLYSCGLQPSKAFLFVPLLTCIQKIPSSDLDQLTSYPDGRFLWFSSVPHITSNQVTTASASFFIWLFCSHSPCWGGLEYLCRSSASRRRWR